MEEAGAKRAKEMKKILVLLFVVTVSVKAAYADTWSCPPEKDYFSDNKLFVAHVTAAKEETKAKLEVFEIDGPERKPLWQCTLGNEGGPGDVFISDDGKHVVTVNECNRRVHGGFGDYVVAFYNEKGIIKNYSLEQILRYPEDIDEQEFKKLTRRSVSGRSWGSQPILLDEYNGELYFCVWLRYGERWLAWEVNTGNEVRINDKMVERWNEKGCLWAREAGVKSKKYCKLALQFLGRFQKPENRKIIESFLNDKDFSAWYRGRFGNPPLFYCRSSNRALADHILAEWDGIPTKKSKLPDEEYHYLGSVKGVIKLSEPPKEENGWICIYLIPGTTNKGKWYLEVPVHQLTAYLGKYYFHNCQLPGSDVPFTIQGITPGEYWIKAVWDKDKPHNFGDNYIKGPPQAGDYESVESLTITVKAGETIENVIIDCTHKVTNGTD